MKVAHTSPTSTEPAQVSSLPRRVPGASGHGKPLGPRPTPPAQQLTADMNPLLRDIDWNGHIPTARTAAGSYTEKTLAAALRDSWRDDTSERVA